MPYQVTCYTQQPITLWDSWHDSLLDAQERVNEGLKEHGGKPVAKQYIGDKGGNVPPLPNGVTFSVIAHER